MDIADYTENVGNPSAFVRLLGVSIQKMDNGYCKGQNIAVLDAEVKDGKDLIAKAIGTYSILKAKTKSEF